jgi:hypothetical protein
MTTRPEADQRSRRELERLIYNYAELIDGGNLEGVARLFAHGRMTGPDGSVLAEGFDDMLSFLSSIIRLYPPGNTPLTQHVMSNLVLDIDDDAGEASGTCYYTVLQKTDDTPLQAIIAGRYRDDYHRVDGKWFFDTRQQHPLLIGDMSRHVSRYA